MSATSADVASNDFASVRRCAAGDFEAISCLRAATMERAVADLPDAFRTVFVLRDVEGFSVEETAEALEIPAATVKSRLFRARRSLQKSLAPEVRSALTGIFPFAGADCERLTARLVDAVGSNERCARKD